MFTLQLQQAGYHVVEVENGETAIELLGRKRFDLMITDLLLPKMHGMQVIAKARALDTDMGVIIVTGEASTNLAIRALNQQVHRYLIKPISQPELLHNVAEVLAQGQRIAERGAPYQLHGADPVEPPMIWVGPLVIDPQRYRIVCDSTAITLTKSEFTLLVYLAQHRGAVVSPLDIARDVLHYACSLQEARDLVKSLTHRLRQKIEAIRPGLRPIRTVRGAGYRLLDEDEIC